MNTYYDTGIILKLYTEERESGAARAFVTGRKEPIYLSAMHTAECGAALRLKQFREECDPAQVAQSLAHMEVDFASRRAKGSAGRVGTSVGSGAGCFLTLTLLPPAAGRWTLCMSRAPRSLRPMSSSRPTNAKSLWQSLLAFV